MASEYKPGQVLTAEELNASFDAKTDNAAAAITGGAAEGLDHVYIVGDVDSTNVSTGALTVTGGVGIGKQLRVGESANIGKTLTVSGVNQSTSPTTGALVVNGGIGAGGNLNVAGAAIIAGTLAGNGIASTDATDSVSPTTGSLKTAGGAGVAKNLYVGGSGAVAGAFSVQGNATVAGTLTAGAVTLSPGGQITFGDGTTQNTKPIPDSPSDGSKYGRKDAAWVVLTDIPEAPQDGTKYARRNAAWVTLVDTPDAPSDAFYYGRHAATWAKVTEEAPSDAFVYGRSGALWVKSVAEAPTDGQQYSRRNGAWQVLSASGLVVAATPPTDTARFPMWWDTNSGTLYIWYDDGNSAQWVICVPTDAIGAAATTATWGNIVGTLTDQLDLKAALDTKPGEAPTTGLMYARKSNTWEIVDSFPEAPNDGQAYVRQAKAWTVATAGGGIPDAPSDGQQYGRQSGAWTVIAAGGASGWTYANDGTNVSQTVSATGAASGTSTVNINAKGSSVPTLNFQQDGNNKFKIAFVGSSYLGISAVGGVDFRMDIFGNVNTFCKQMNLSALDLVGLRMSMDSSSLGGQNNFVMNKKTGGYINQITGSQGGKERWGIVVGDDTAETGSGNVGTNFAIKRYADAGGNALDAPFSIIRATGYVRAPTFQSQSITSTNTNGDVNVYGETSPLAWPNINCGMVAVRAKGNVNFGAGAVTCYSGSGNTGVTLMDGATSWTAVSDEREKNIIGDVGAGLEAVMSWRPIRYRLLSDDIASRARIGFTAQSINPTAPEAIDEIPVLGPDGTPTADSRFGLRATDLLPHIVAAIKELNIRLAAVEAHFPPATNPGFDSGFSNGFGG